MNWQKKDIPQDLVKTIASKYSCDLLTASILVRRGITRGEDIRYFLEADTLLLRNPFELPGMEDAVDRILAAKEEGEKVLVFGDKDTDGVTGASLLTGFLKTAGLDVAWRLPSGDEPYGLSMKAVEEFAAEYGTLIITVDCGISNAAEVQKAGELGIQVIITDHHNPQEKIPDALAVINPKLSSSAYSFRDLAGCAVAYKLVSALRFAMKSEIYGQSICLLNTRPSTDAYTIEIAKMRNLAVIDTLSETVVPGMVSITETRLPRFLQGQQILVWDAALQKKTLGKIFGSGVEVGMLDIAGEIGKDIPQAAGKSLLRLRELSRFAKYAEKPIGELDVFINLFSTFIQKREQSLNSEDAGELQLAALGTVGDIMPLTDENRIIVRAGLASLAEKPRSGISELLFKLNLSGQKLGGTEISWRVCPAINAAGRLGQPEKAASLFLSEDGGERDRLAAGIIAMNEDRKKMGDESWALAEPMAAKSLETYNGALTLAAGEGILRGVTGLLAGRLAERFNAPSMVVSLGEKVFTGSLRSVRGYDLTLLLETCADLFLDWGGHSYAAGFSLDKSNWEPFLERLKTAAASIQLEEKKEEVIEVDAELPLSYLTPEIFKVSDLFEPYGEKNPPLTFLARSFKIDDLSLMGKNGAKHVKLMLDAGKYKWPAKYWNAADKVKTEFDLGDRADVVFRLSRNKFAGKETLELVVTDLRRSSGHE